MPTPTIPAKIQSLLDAAGRHGLKVDFAEDTHRPFGTTVHTWAITSGRDWDRDALWIIWVPGPRGGRVTLRRYAPDAPQRRQRSTKITRPSFYTWIVTMGESLRHRPARST